MIGHRRSRPSEVLHTPPDKHFKGLPRESRRKGTPPGRASLWTASEVQIKVPEPIFGCYPKTFLTFALRELRTTRDEVLHVCSGALSAEHGGVRVDVRGRAAPTVRADGRALPFRDSCFRAVLLDPPYSVEYAKDLYGTEYPRPSHLLREALRVVQPCGRIGFVHFLVPMPPKGARFVRVWGVTQGCGYRMRAFTILERRQDNLPSIA